MFESYQPSLPPCLFSELTVRREAGTTLGAEHHPEFYSFGVVWFVIISMMDLSMEEVYCPKCPL